MSRTAPDLPQIPTSDSFFFMPSYYAQPQPSANQRRSHVGNRRRNGYELTRQRDMVPIALGAGLAAVVLHVMAWFYVPSVFLWNEVDKLLVDEVEAEEEVVRVVVREQPKEELAEAEPEVEQPQEMPQEIEQLEPTEIDILDMENIDVLDIAPGETAISLPEPAVTADAPEAADIITPEPINVANLPTEAPEPAFIAPPEPAPVNSNDVIANITAQPDEAAEEASAMMEESLKREASDGSNPMPGDTRSLAELMGIENPGAKSGVARLGADVLFAFDKCQLKNAARITMLQLAALVLKNPSTNFVIEGHTDSFGGEEYNALLSLQRAAAVREWLMKNGVPVEHVYLRACGNNNPLADTKASKEEQSLNRRVEIHMRREGEALPTGSVPFNVQVDTVTPVATQIANGVRVPEAYASAYGKKKADAKPAAPAKGAGKTGKNGR